MSSPKEASSLAEGAAASVPGGAADGAAACDPSVNLAGPVAFADMARSSESIGCTDDTLEAALAATMALAERADAGAELDGAETVGAVGVCAAAHGIEEDLLASDVQFLAEAVRQEGRRSGGASGVASSTGRASMAILDGSVDVLVEEEAHEVLTAAVQIQGLAEVSSGIASTLQFVGCTALPELQGEYQRTEEGRDDLEHEYPTYKQVVAGAGVSMSRKDLR